ncbi:MAG: long-chain-fatty-acid--CoA ligase [Myxococcales bacterium]|nr:long-chain-fatty-acid--CoA ligase [Myxococcales bacterium]
MRNNVGMILSKRAHLSPELEGYVGVETGRRFSYAELNERSNRVANALRELGVKKGDRVAFLLMNSVEFFESFFAVAKIGAINVPLNWRLVPDELAFILKDSGATALLYGEEFADAVLDLHGRGAEGTDISKWIHVGEDEARGEFSKSYSELTDAASTDEPEIEGEDEDELYIMYTSGTTGLPKGAVHTHETAIWACHTMVATADMRYRDRYIVALPMFHVGALTPLTGNVHRGVTNCVMRAFDPALTWKTIESERVTVMLAVPAMLNFMLQVPEQNRGDYSTLRWCMSGAAPVPVSLIETYAKLGIEIHQVYGLTESCGPACLISPEQAIAKAGSTGKAFFHTSVRVVNDQGEDCEPGEMGEVIIAGKHIMKEYWNRPAETADTIRDGWLYSGDLASIDKEGFVYIQDRIKDMIISGGENVYPAEIENVLLQHPKLADAAVIGQPSARWGESPVAVVVRSEEVEPAAILEYCSGKLARFKLPKTVEFVDEIPRNPSGKILKRLLREQFPGPAPE